jgi:site-specific recombinase XerD
MKLSMIVAEYVTFKKGLGMRFRAEAVILKAFYVALGEMTDVTAVQPGQVVAYLNGRGPLTSFWHRKFEALTGFYRYALGRGYVEKSPLPSTTPKRPPSFLPYIYTAIEVRRLLDATWVVDSVRSQLQSVTFSVLLLLLYGTGLRIGEALRLRMVDVDLDMAVLTIECSKFYKSRLVPTGPQLTDALRAYAGTRRRRPCPQGEDSAFFPTTQGAPLSLACVEKHFRQVCDTAAIRREDGARYQPRLHDMRHAFAVTRLVTWYREGADVPRLLPHLSTYLGHLNLAATQRYITMTSELLYEAGRRFERYALSEVRHD